MLSVRSHRTLAAAAGLALAPGLLADTPFRTAQSIAVGGAPRDIVAADFNGDGRIDIAASSDTQNAVLVFLEDGRGSFLAPHSIPVETGGKPSSLHATDINRDGHTDLVVALPGISRICAFVNEGSARFMKGPEFRTGRGADGLVPVELDGDGHLEFVTFSRDENTITLVHLGEGGEPHEGATSIPSGGIGPVGVAAGDFNRDRIVDLAVAHSESREVVILMGDRSGGFRPDARLTYPRWNGPTSVRAADMDDDGTLDLIVTSPNGATTGHVIIFTGSPVHPGQFVTGPAVKTGGVGPDFARVGDVDGDRRPDVVVANRDSGSIAVLRNIGNGASPLLAEASLVNWTGVPSEMALQPLRHGGPLDLLIGDERTGTITVLENTSRPACMADFDGSGIVSVGDIFEYSAAWIGGKSRAEMDGAAGLTLDDLFAFLNAWFAGC